MNLLNNNGIALIFHCVPSEINPEIEKFWVALREELNNNGMEVFLVTTTELENQTIPHVQVPFSLEHYSDSASDSSKFNIKSNHVLLKGLEKWYNIDSIKSLEIYSIAWDFYESLIDAIQPALIISWQSMHPVSRIVREISNARGIPWWASERGWVKNTLMIDMGENNYLSEVTSSYTLSRVYNLYKTNHKLINLYKEKTNQYKSIERYPYKHLSKSDIRKKYKIPIKSKIYAFFSHGEPHVGAMDSLYGLQRQHELLPDYLFSKIVEIAYFLEKRGDYLIVKEHPFNIYNNRKFNFENIPNVIVSEDSVDDIVFNSDYFLFSLSTLQFEIALLGRSFGLLCRGLLSGINEAPLVSDFDSIDNFIFEMENQNAFSERRNEIERKISFLLDYFLIALDDLSFKDSIEILVDHLCKYRGLQQDLAKDNIIDWLKKKAYI
jgi:hypothetical protein